MIGGLPTLYPRTDSRFVMRTNQLFLSGLIVLSMQAASVTRAQDLGAQYSASSNPTSSNSPSSNPAGGASRTNQYATGPVANPTAVADTAGQANPTGLQINWRRDMASARREADQTGKLLLLHFYTQPCIYCEKLEAGAFRDPIVIAEIESKFVPLRIYGPDNAKAMEVLKVDRFPTEVIINVEDSTVLMKSVSPQDPYAFVSMLATATQQRAALKGQMAANTQPAFDNSMNGPANSSTINGPTIYGPAMNGPAMGVDARLTSSANQSYVDQPMPPGQPSASLNLQNQLPAEFQQPAYQPDYAATQQGQHTQPQFPQQPQFQTQTPFELQPQPHSPTQMQGHVESQEPMMEGYCLVTMATEWRWKMGDPKIAAMHLGRLYLFASEDAREKFLADPERFAPVMNGLDVVKFFDEGQIVEGIRAKGCTTRDPDRIFFFSSEDSLAKFEASEQSQAFYTSRAIELARRAAADANGGR